MSDANAGVLAKVDTADRPWVVTGFGLVLLLMGGGAALEEVYLLTVLTALPGAFFFVLSIGTSGHLVLTQESISLVSRMNTFASKRVVWSIPLSELATVRTWRENRRSEASNSHYSVRILQVRDARGEGYRITRQHIPPVQLERLGRALAALGLVFEELERPPS